jgi:hypothetical protein
MTVTPTAADTTATITVNGYSVASGSASSIIILNYGSNTIRVEVKAQDGVTIKVYAITVTRSNSNVNILPATQIQAESYASMSGVSIVTTTDSSGTSDVASLNTGDSMTYNISVPVTGTYTIQYRYRNSTFGSTRTVQVRLDGSTSGLVSTSLGYNTAWGTASSTFTLSAGFHTLQIYVSAGPTGTGDTTLRINWFTISYSGTVSNGTVLSGLGISQGTLTPVFASGTYSYTDSVSYATTSMNVTPTVSSANANATVTVNGVAVASGSASQAINLDVGANTITVTVTAQDTTTMQTYTITVTRASS